MLLNGAAREEAGRPARRGRGPALPAGVARACSCAPPARAPNPSHNGPGASGGSSVRRPGLSCPARALVSVPRGERPRRPGGHRHALRRGPRGRPGGDGAVTRVHASRRRTLRPGPAREGAPLPPAPPASPRVDLRRRTLLCGGKRVSNEALLCEPRRGTGAPRSLPERPRPCAQKPLSLDRPRVAAGRLVRTSRLRALRPPRPAIPLRGAGQMRDVPGAAAPEGQALPKAPSADGAAVRARSRPWSRCLQGRGPPVMPVSRTFRAASLP